MNISVEIFAWRLIENIYLWIKQTQIIHLSDQIKFYTNYLADNQDTAFK